MIYDRTFCSDINCKDINCKRNQNNYKFEDKFISISDFPQCEKFTKNIKEET